MADILLFPNISFDESDVGPRPLISATGNRIGVVGEFLRGPANKFMLIDTPDNLMKVLGKSTHNGSVAIQTAMDQGARDFGVMRVMGSGANAAAFLRFTLGGGASTVAETGKVILMSTGVKVPVVGNGVTTKEQVANLIASAIRASRVAGLSATVTGSTITLSSSLASADALPLSFRMTDRDNFMATVADTGILLKDAQNNVVDADKIIRLAGGTLQLTVDYDQTALAATLTIANSDVTPDDGDTLTVQIGGVSRTVTIKNTSESVVSLTTAPAVGETVSVTIDGMTQSHVVGGADTLAAIFTDIKDKFDNSGAGLLTKVDLTVDGDDLLIEGKANISFDAVPVAASVSAGGGPVTGVIAVSEATVTPVITTPAGMALNLARLFASHADVTVTASGDTLIARPRTTLNAPVLLGAAGNDTITGIWDLTQLLAPTGVNKTTAIHVMLGAEANVTEGLSTAQTIAADLSKSINDRNLSVSSDLLSSNTELKLTSRFNGRVGNETLFGIFQLVGSDQTTIDANLTIEQKPAVTLAAYATADNGSYVPFGGGMDGPLKGSYIFRRRKFVRAQAAGTPEFAGGTVTMTLTAGEVAINSFDKIDLTGKTVTCSVGTAPAGQAAKSLIVAKEDGTLQAKVAADTNEVVIGEYAVTGAQSLSNPGRFTPAPAVNGDVIRVEAASEGTWTKDLRVTAISEENEVLRVVATYKTVTDENYNSETFEFRLADLDVLDGGQPYPMVRKTKNSNLINVFYVGGSEDGKLAEVLSETQALIGGDNGPPVTVQDYVNVLEKMALNPVNILIASGMTHPVVRDRLIRQAEASDEISGLRISVLAADRALSPASAKLLTNGIDSKYGVMVGGYATYTGRNDLAPLSVPPDGFYAGHLAVTPVEASPAARTSSPSFKGIAEVDTIPGTQAYNEYTKARIEMIIADQVTKVFHCLNGRSLSVDTAWNWISLRRIYNFIRANAFQALQFAKSEPNTPQLRKAVADTVDNLLFAMFSKKQIAGYQPTKADDENNPANMVAQGLLRVDVFFTPVYPADFITVGLHRTVAVALTVSTGN